MTLPTHQRLHVKRNYKSSVVYGLVLWRRKKRGRTTTEVVFMNELKTILMKIVGTIDQEVRC